MSVHKDVKRGTWFAKIKYTDWAGNKKETTKRGFAKKKDAQLFEQEFLRQKTESPSMTLESLYHLYMEDLRHRIRPTTYSTKESIFSNRILPHLGQYPCDKITPKIIRQWQNLLVADEYSPTYLKMINGQLVSLFNFAVKYYGLYVNPMKSVDTIGKSSAEAMQFWTVDEFNRFILTQSSPLHKTIFMLLFWTGMRVGELLALTYADFDLEKKIVRVQKSYIRLKGKDLIGPPKTPGSNRVVSLPSFLVDNLMSFFESLKPLDPNARLFIVTRASIRRLHTGAKKAGVKLIRIHDLRHSHASYLIHIGVPIMEVSKRLGHDKIETTLRTYAHLYPKEHDVVLEAIENDPQIIRGSNQGHNGCSI